MSETVRLDRALVPRPPGGQVGFRNVVLPVVSQRWRMARPGFCPFAMVAYQRRQIPY